MKKTLCAILSSSLLGISMNLPGWVRPGEIIACDSYESSFREMAITPPLHYFWKEVADRASRQSGYRAFQTAFSEDTHIRGYPWTLLSYGIASMGVGFSQVAQPILMWNLTHDPLFLSYQWTAQYLPNLFAVAFLHKIPHFGGMRSLANVQYLRGAVWAATAAMVSMRAISPTHLLMVTFFQGVLTLLSAPTFLDQIHAVRDRNAILGESINKVIYLFDRVGPFVGFLLTGWALAHRWDLAAFYGISALGFLIFGAAVTRTSSMTTRTRVNLISRRGAFYSLWPIVIPVFLLNVGVMSLISQQKAILSQEFHQPSSMLAISSAMYSFATVVGVVRYRSHERLEIPLFAMGFALLLLAISPTISVFFTTVFVAGLLNGYMGRASQEATGRGILDDYRKLGITLQNSGGNIGTVIGTLAIGFLWRTSLGFEGAVFSLGTLLILSGLGFYFFAKEAVGKVQRPWAKIAA